MTWWGFPSEQRPVHIGAGIPFVGIAHDVLEVPLGLPAGFPFGCGGEAAASTTPQPGKFDFLYHFFGGHPGKGLDQGRIPSSGDIIIDITVKISPRILEDDLFLIGVEWNVRFPDDLLAVGRIGVKELLDDFTADQGAVDDIGDLVQTQLFIENIFRFDDGDRAAGAKSVAAGGGNPEVLLQALFRHSVLEGFGNRLPRLGSTGRSSADPYPFFDPFPTLQDILTEKFQFSRVIQTIHSGSVRPLSLVFLLSGRKPCRAFISL